MPRQKAADPLIPLPCRLPASLVARLAVKAKEQSVTMSDVLRSHLTLAEAKPLGKPVPRRRAKNISKVSGADPVLMRQISGIGNNLNQLAKLVHLSNISASPLDIVEILIRLRGVEQSLERLCRA